MTYHNRPYSKRFRPWWHDYHNAAAWLIGAGDAAMLTLVFAARADAGQAPLVVGVAAGLAFVVARFYWYRGQSFETWERTQHRSLFAQKAGVPRDDKSGSDSL
jgi:hypothetical protein